MKKRLIAVLLIAAMSMSLLTACRDSGERTATKDVAETGYSAEEAVKDFEFGELNDTEKIIPSKWAIITVTIWLLQSSVKKPEFMKP